MQENDRVTSSPASTMDRAELEQAFTLFTEASRQLVESYQELEQKVASLTRELAVANGALRQQFEEKAALSSRLGALLSALPAGVVELDQANRVVTANPAAVAIFGQALVGQVWSEVVERILAPIAESPEWQLAHPDGNVRRLTLAESQLASGERIMLIHDVSEDWRLRQQLEHHQRLAAMGEMAAGLAHQLRTPLATALLYTANLTKPHLGEAERVKFGEKSLARLRHLETLIKNMLQFVRGQQAELERVDLVAVLEDALQTVQPQDAGSTRHWVVAVEPASAWVAAGRKELTGALINLLENALQATAPGDAIKLALSARGGDWQVTLQDEGCGMDATVQDRLFEPFFTTRKEGTGLGLAIVRNLVSAYGGRIDVVSAPGEGATFTILLPARD
ncbi:PAS domain-containing sensor histidine kinase [Chitinimonas sp. BJYL2]|uniref:sensor histidine kinase n=1 Tax=Chitinimonas sp. BJYL2 TaxID=2976696 RepID=UPI0022B347D2|nr:ATP-binding protein [Chitinimonas sp. BJYL2]